MNTITDDQIAEIERDFKSGVDVYAPRAVMRGLITRLREAERWKADASQVLNPLLDYAHSLGLAKLGHSVTEALIEDHKRLREAERDAARYRFIREVASGTPEDFEVVACAAFAAAYECGHNFDLNIDEAMLEAGK